MKKRLVSALLALSMLCSAVPAPAFARGADSTGLEQEQCSCSIRCTADGMNPDCPVCAADAAACGAGLDPATVETADPEPTPEATATPEPTGSPAPAGEPVPQTLGAAPSLLAANDEVSTLAAPTTLTVGGTDVLDGSYWLTNADGTLTADGAIADNYNVYYDGDGTLTLKDATINGTDTIGHVGTGIYAEGDLTIVLEGSSTVTGVQDPNGDSQSIRVSGNLTIQGGGSLTAQGAETSSGSSYGIFVIGSFTQQGGSVTAIGGNINGNYTSTGLYVYGGTVTAQDGTLTATGGDTSGSSYGISMASSSSVTVGSAAVTATGGTGNYSYGLYVNPSSPSVSPSVTLSGSGSLTARSGSGTDTAVGIYLNNIWGSTGSVTVGNGSTLLTNSVILFDNSFEAKPLTPTGDGSWLIYGQSDQPSAVGGTYTLTDDLTIENGNTFTIPAGSTLTVPQGKTLTVNGTLNIANQSSLTGSGSLAGSGAFNLTNPEPVISGSETLTYDGTDHFNEFKLEAPSGSVEVMGQSFTISSSPSLEGWSLGTQEIKNAGTYTLTASNGTTTIEKEVTVKPATISITSATVQDKTYDGGTDATVDTVTFDGLVNGESLTSGTDYTATAAFTDKNAGDSKQATVTVTLTNGNYTFSSNGNTATATAKISPLAVALSWSETTSFTYDGQPHSVTATINNAVSGDDVSVAYDSNSTNTNKATAAGAYTATVSGLSGNDANNYTLTGVSNTTQAWSITTADSQLGLTVDKSDNTYTYGEIITFTVKPEVRAANGISLLAENTVTFTVGDVELGSVTATEGQEVKFTYNTTVQKLAPGTHTVTATYTGGGNLNGTSETVTVTLAAKTLTAAINGNTTKTYDGTTEATGLSLALTGVGSGDTVTATAASYGYNSPNVTEANAVTASGITLGGQDAGFYTVNATATTTGTITPATLTVTADNQTKTYGDADPELTYTATGLVGEDKLNGELARNAGEDVGDYAITQGTLSAGSNYTIQFTDANLSIAPLAASLTWDYTAPFTYDGTEKSVTATVANKVGDDTFTLTYEGNTGTAANTYTAKVTGLGNANYTLDGATSTEQAWSIAKAKPTVTDVAVSSLETIYDTTEFTSIILSHAGTDTPGTVALDEGQTLTVGAKEYNWTFTPTDTINYTTATGSITLTVKGDVVESIAVTTPPTKTAYTYGESFDKTGMEVTATYESGKTKDVTKEVTVSPETLDTSVSALTIAYGELTTTQPITVNPKVVSNPSIELSGTSFEFTGEAITPTVVSVKDGETVIPETEYTVSYSNNVNVGTNATVTITDKEGGNYTVSGSTTFQITKVKATVTKAPTANTLTYTGQPQTLVTAGTADGGEMQYSTQENGTYNSAIPTGTNVGSYSVWYKVVGDENHSDTQPMEVKVTINQASIAEAEVTLSPESFTYNGQSQTPTVTVKLNGNALTEGDYTVTYSGDSIDAGTYTVTVTGKGNYSGTATEKPTYTINPAPLTISGATLADKTYDGTTAATVTDVTFTEVQGSDSLTPGEDYTATAVFDDAGAGTDKTATVTVTLKNGNYKLASDTYQLTGQTLAKANAAVTAAPTAVADLTYNGQAQALVTAGTATGGTMVYSLEQNGKYAESIPTGTNAGDYTVWYKVAGDANHNDTAPASEQVTIATKAATVTVQLDPANRITAGDDLPTVGLTYSGLVEDESIAPASITVDGMPANTDTAGEYKLTVSMETKTTIESLETAKNYILNFEGTSLTILDKTVEELPSEDEEHYRLEKSNLTEVPAELKQQYNSVDNIQDTMYAVAVKALPGVTAENTELHDVTLLFSEDGGKTWVKATEENFPKDGITVTLPYPDGTNAADYDFVVTHMATVAMNGLGVGEVETPAVTKTADGLRFTVKSLSPVAVSWKLAPKTESSTGSGESTSPAATPAPTATPAPDGTVYYTCPACGHHDWIATDEGYRCDTCGYVESLKQLAGYGNVKGVYEPKTTGSAAAGTATATVPQTGDESNPVLWLGLLIVSGLALGGLAIAKRKKQQK